MVAALTIEAVTFHLLRRRSSGTYGTSIWEFLIMWARSEHIWTVTANHTRPQKSFSIFVQSEECHEYFFLSCHHAADGFLSLDNYYSCYWMDFGIKFQKKFPVCCSAIVLIVHKATTSQRNRNTSLYCHCTEHSETPDQCSRGWNTYKHKNITEKNESSRNSHSVNKPNE